MAAIPPPQAIIGGATRLLVIIGDPIAQVKSPGTLNPRLAAAGRDIVMVPVHVRPERFEETVRGLMAVGNLDGITVTVPYKIRILPFADTVLPNASACGAINALRREPDGRWTGDMFDGVGLVAGLRERGLDPGGRRVMLIGAGGAGSAVAAAFAEAGAAAVTIHDVDGPKARALAARVSRVFPACAVRAEAPDLASHDILVNATPVGMGTNAALPIPLDGLKPETLVVDVVTTPEVTPFLAAARERGCQALGGRTMHDGQQAALIRFFTGGAA